VDEDMIPAARVRASLGGRRSTRRRRSLTGSARVAGDEGEGAIAAREAREARGVENTDTDSKRELE
jgi:hypothetical protein